MDSRWRAVTAQRKERRRNPAQRGPRKVIWPDWMRSLYLALTTPWGLWITRIAFGVVVFGFIAGGAMLLVIKNIPPARVETIERKVETVKKKAVEAEEKAEQAERRVQEEAETIERRLERIEDAITPYPRSR